MQGRTDHRSRLGGCILAAALAAAPLAAGAEGAPTRSRVWKDTLTLWAGERVTVRLPESGQPDIVSVTPAPEAEATPPKPGKGAFADPAPGTVVLLLGRVGGQLHLKIESGIAKTFDYRAELITQAAPDNLLLDPVKACSVLPLLASYEAWPTAAATGVRLHAFKLRDTNDVVCPEAQQRPLRRERTP